MASRATEQLRRDAEALKKRVAPPTPVRESVAKPVDFADLSVGDWILTLGFMIGQVIHLEIRNERSLASIALDTDANRRFNVEWQYVLAHDKSLPGLLAVAQKEAESRHFLHMDATRRKEGIDDRNLPE
jgi:hypothetical protein